MLHALVPVHQLLVPVHQLLVAASPAPVVTTAPVVPAVADTGVGLLGFLIVCALLVVCVGLFFAMRGSLRRLGTHENDGSFGGRHGSAPPRP